MLLVPLSSSPGALGLIDQITEPDYQKIIPSRTALNDTRLYFDIEDFTRDSLFVNVTRLVQVNRWGFLRQNTTVTIFNNGSEMFNLLNITIPKVEDPKIRNWIFSGHGKPRHARSKGLTGTCTSPAG